MVGSDHNRKSALGSVDAMPIANDLGYEPQHRSALGTRLGPPTLTSMRMQQAIRSCRVEREARCARSDHQS